MHAFAAGLERLDRDEVALREILDPVADLDHLAAELVAENDRILHAREGMRLARARRDGAVVVFVQIAAADAVVTDAQLHIARAHFRLRNVLEPHIASPVIDRCPHRSTLPLSPAISIVCRPRRGHTRS
jgi:hypothetical protein